MAITVVKGDRRTLTLTFKDGGSGYDLSAATRVVVARIKPDGSSDEFNTVTNPSIVAFQTDGTDGVVLITPDSTFWNSSKGSYKIWGRVEYAASGPQRFPEVGAISVNASGTI